MRTPLILILLATLFVQFSFAFTPAYLDPTIERPWEFNHYAVPDYIISIMQNSPENTDIDTSYLYAVDSSTASQLTNEINSAKNADEDFTKVGESKYLILNSIKDWFNETASMSAKAISSWFMLHIDDFLSYSGSSIMQTTSYGMHIVSLCAEHYTSAADSVEESEKAYNGLLSKVTSGREDLIHMGATSGSYSGQYANDIAQLESTLSSIDGAALKSREEQIKSDALLTATSGSAYSRFISESSSQVRYLLDGDSSAFSKLLFAYSVEKKISAGLLSERTTARSTAESQSSTVSSEYSRITSEYNQITDADVVYFNIATLQTLDSPSSHIAAAGASLTESSYEILQGDSAFNAKAQGYVTESTTHYYTASAKLDSASFSLREAERTGIFILETASALTQDEYAFATSEASAFIPKTPAEERQLAAAQLLIVKAQPNLDKGKSASERLANLKLAYNDLKLARSYLSPGAVFRANAKDSATNSLTYLKSVIDRARDDSIDVSYEESYYNEKSIALKGGNLPPEQMVNISLSCTLLSEQIFARGAAQYGSLSLRYAQAAPLAEYFESLDGKPLKEYAQLNSYLGKDGKFDSHASLGHYSEIAGFISGLELQISFKSKELIRESLELNARVSAAYGNSTMLLDSPSTRQVYFATYGVLDLNYNGPVTITVPFAYDVSKSNPTLGPDWSMYSYSSGKLSLMIPKYTPGHLYSITFEDSQTLVRTISVKEDAVLASPTRLKVTVERQIASTGAPSLQIPSYYNYAYSLYYDGEYAGSFNYDAKISREIAPGSHRLTSVYLIDDPIIVSASDASRSGTSTSIRLNVASAVPFDIENAQLSYDLPVLSPSSLTISSPDCAISAQDHTLLPTATRITVTLRALLAKSRCTLDIHASAPLNKDAIQNEIDAVANDSTSYSNGDVSASLSRAQGALDSGNYEDALKAVDDAKAKLADANQLATQSAMSLSEVLRLDAEISTAIAGLSTVRNSDVQKSLSKIKSYYAASQSESTNDKKLVQLRKANEELLGLNALAYSQASEIGTKLNSLKQRWLYLIDKGYATSLPAEIAQVESTLNNATGAITPDAALFAQFDSAYVIISSLDGKTKLAEKDSGDWESGLKEKYKAQLTALKSSAAQLTKACSTKCPQEMVSYSQSLLSLNPTTPGEYASAIEKMNSTISSINAYVASERTAANSAIGDLRNALSALSDQRLKDALTNKLYDIESMYKEGSYSSAKDSAVIALASLSGTPQSSPNDYTLIIAGIAVIAISFILLKMRENNSKAQEDISKQVKQLKREK